MDGENDAQELRTPRKPASYLDECLREIASCKNADANRKTSSFLVMGELVQQL
jgi:hypothetical protein